MATVDRVSSGGLSSARIRHTSLVLFTAGSSLFSRVSTAGMLIIAARKLSTTGLGVFATLFGIGIATAYVLASTSGNVLAYWTRANPMMTGRVARLILAVAAVNCMVSVSLYLGAGDHDSLGTVAATLALLVGGLTATIVLQVLRGTGRLALAVTAGFLIPSVLRLGLSVVLSGQVTVTQMLGASATAASLGAVTGGIIVIVLRSATFHLPRFNYHWSMRLSLAAGTVGLMWFALGQIDLTSLTIIRGAAAGGEYAPTMRAFEAMNALGLAVAFVSIRALAGASLQTAIARMRRIVPPSLTLYVIITLPLLLFGHEVLTALLHRHVFWSPIAVVCLAVGYGGNLVMAVCFETLASQQAISRLFGVAIAILSVSLVITPLAVLLWGTFGAAIGNSLSYLFGGIIVFVVLNHNTATPPVSLSQTSTAELAQPQCA